MISSSRYKLAWRYDILCIGLNGFQKTYFVDAYTGEVFRETNIGRSNGPAVITFNANRTIDTKQRGFPHHDWILQTDDATRNIHTKYYSSNAWFIQSNVKKSNDIWNATEVMATDPHWIVSEAWDYYLTVHSRTGMNDHGSIVKVQGNWNQPQAHFIRRNGDSYIEIGTVNNLYLATLDIVGHEYMHGITWQTSNLTGWDEAGALDESFSDIMGEALERWFRGTNDWVTGNDLGTGVDLNGAMLRRSLQNPSALGSNADPNNGCSKSTGNPDTYLGTFWNTDDSCDNGGIHSNCGVQNFCFFLLSQGGSGTNDNGGFYSVTGIGADDAALIAYNTVVNNLTSVSQFTNSRANSIAVARAIFGTCSNEEIQTQNAWAAVGIGFRSLCQNNSISTFNQLEKKSTIYIP
ncbi:MAG: M4 family metallopeptidase [Bacteroidota bacterium]|nr:M4 family metallopeptidase [Bacteroidota bacterium]